jgi:hypothetical protein
MPDQTPFESLPDDVQAFLIDRLAESIGGARIVFFSTRWTADDPFLDYIQPTATTHVLHVRADGSHCYHGKDFKFWG